MNQNNSFKHITKDDNNNNDYNCKVIGVFLRVSKVSSYMWCLFIVAALWKICYCLLFTQERSERSTVYTLFRII